MVPALCVVPEYEGTIKLTVPFPEPLLPDVIEIRSGLLFVAVQLHPPGAVTFMEPLPPEALKV